LVVLTAKLGTEELAKVWKLLLILNIYCLLTFLVKLFIQNNLRVLYLEATLFFVKLNALYSFFDWRLLDWLDVVVIPPFFPWFQVTHPLNRLVRSTTISIVLIVFFPDIFRNRTLVAFVLSVYDGF
jgi:hypothetical protein